MRISNGCCRSLAYSDVRLLLGRSTVSLAHTDACGYVDMFFFLYLSVLSVTNPFLSTIVRICAYRICRDFSNVILRSDYDFSFVPDFLLFFFQNLGAEFTDPASTIG